MTVQQYYVWTVAILTSPCGAPLVAAVFLRGDRRPFLHRAFAAGAALVGLAAPWLYLAWHGPRFGYRHEEFQGFTACALVLLVLAPLLHGALAHGPARRLSRSTAWERERATAAGDEPPMRADLILRLRSRAAPFIVASSIALGVGVGRVLADGMGYPGGLRAMWFPPPPGSLPVWYDVTRGCVRWDPYAPVLWSLLPFARLLVLAGCVTISCSGGVLRGAYLRRGRRTSDPPSWSAR